MATFSFGLYIYIFKKISQTHFILFPFNLHIMTQITHTFEFKRQAAVDLGSVHSNCSCGTEPCSHPESSCLGNGSGPAPRGVCPRKSRLPGSISPQTAIVDESGDGNWSWSSEENPPRHRPWWNRHKRDARPTRVTQSKDMQHTTTIVWKYFLWH